jgi:hypothetical protein
MKSFIKSIKTNFMEVIIALPFLAIPLVMPTISGLMAKSFGRRFWPWFWLGFPLPFISNIILLCLPDLSQKKQAASAENEDVVDYPFINNHEQQKKRHDIHLSARA